MITRELLQINSQTFQDHSWNEKCEYFGKKISEKNRWLNRNFYRFLGRLRALITFLLFLFRALNRAWQVTSCVSLLKFFNHAVNQRVRKNRFWRIFEFQSWLLVNWSRLIVKHRSIDKISKNWNIIFDYIFFIFDYVKKCHFWPIKYRLSQNRLPVSLWKCENQVRDPKLGLETCLVDPFCDFHFWPSIHVRVPTYSRFGLGRFNDQEHQYFRKVPVGPEIECCRQNVLQNWKTWS